MRSIGLKALASAAVLSVAMATPAFADGLSGTAAATTDYLFRGITQTLDKPTVQASIGYDFGSGFSIGVWGSGIDFGDGKSSLETDYSATMLDDIGISVGGIYYAYPTSHNSWNYNYFEGWVGLSKDFGMFSVNGSVYYSPEFFGLTSGDAWYAQGGVGIPLTDWLSVAGNYGYQTVSSTGYFGPGRKDYSNWNLGVTGTYKAYSLNVMYSQTDLPSTAGDAKVVIMLSASF